MPYALLSALAYLLIFGLIIGLIVWATKFIPDANTQQVVRVVMLIIIVIFVLLWLLSMLPAGGWSGHLPR